MTAHQPWDAAIAGLAAWHTQADRAAAHSALSFLEPELRRCLPSDLGSAFRPEEREDLLADFLRKLLERPLPDAIEHPRAYLTRAFRNHSISALRARQKHAVAVSLTWDVPDDGPGTGALADSADDREERASLWSHLDTLPIADRVALKLVHAPTHLTGPEQDWLAERSGLTPVTLNTRLATIHTAHDAMELFEPPDDTHATDRRRRMERFRRRRARALTKLREAWTGEAP